MASDERTQGKDNAELQAEIEAELEALGLLEDGVEGLSSEEFADAEALRIALGEGDVGEVLMASRAAEPLAELSEAAESRILGELLENIGQEYSNTVAPSGQLDSTEQAKQSKQAKVLSFPRTTAVSVLAIAAALLLAFQAGVWKPVESPVMPRPSVALLRAQADALAGGELGELDAELSEYRTALYGGLP